TLWYIALQCRMFSSCCNHLHLRAFANAGCVCGLSMAPVFQPRDARQGEHRLYCSCTAPRLPAAPGRWNVAEALPAPNYFTATSPLLHRRRRTREVVGVRTLPESM